LNFHDVRLQRPAGRAVEKPDAHRGICGRRMRRSGRRAGRTELKRQGKHRKSCTLPGRRFKLQCRRENPSASVRSRAALPNEHRVHVRRNVIREATENNAQKSTVRPNPSGSSMLASERLGFTGRVGWRAVGPAALRAAFR
jgi:hypothetical protein